MIGRRKPVCSYESEPHGYGYRAGASLGVQRGLPVCPGGEAAGAYGIRLHGQFHAIKEAVSQETASYDALIHQSMAFFSTFT